MDSGRLPWFQERTTPSSDEIKSPRRVTLSVRVSIASNPASRSQTVKRRILLSNCQGMGRKTRVSIESMEENAAYIHGGRVLGRDAS
jgi:hypothetical protein